MGGGTMLRSVGRLAPFGATGRGAGGPAAAAVCSSCTGAPHGSLRAAAAVSSDCVCEKAAGTSSSQSFLQNNGSPRRSYDHDEWVFTGDELERPEYGIRDHLVFGKPPTHAEVEEATFELQSALNLGLIAPERADIKSSHPLSRNESNSSLRDAEKPNIGGSKDVANRTVDWVEPQLVRSTSQNVQFGYVVEAFHLLQTTPVVQGVVMSLAQDKAVWNAILNNDKVKELRRQLQESGDDEDKDADIEGRADLAYHGLNLLSTLFEGAKHKIVHFTELLLDFIKNMFSEKGSVGGEAAEWTFKAGDRTFWTFKAGDATDRTLRSCFMLAMIVTFIVLVKRTGTI